MSRKHRYRRLRVLSKMVPCCYTENSTSPSVTVLWSTAFPFLMFLHNFPIVFFFFSFPSSLLHQQTALDPMLTHTFSACVLVTCPCLFESLFNVKLQCPPPWLPPHSTVFQLPVLTGWEARKCLLLLIHHLGSLYECFLICFYIVMRLTKMFLPCLLLPSSPSLFPSFPTSSWLCTQTVYVINFLFVSKIKL